MIDLDINKISIFWQRVYAFALGFSLCLLLFGYFGFTLLIVAGILLSAYADIKLDRQKRVRR